MVYEMHGTWANAGKQPGSWVQLRDRGKWIEIQMPDYTAVGMTPEQARYLARKLYRLARIIERKDAET